jgi:hypothetical protein
LRGFAVYQLVPAGATKNVTKPPRFSQEDSLQFSHGAPNLSLPGKGMTFFTRKPVPVSLSILLHMDFDGTIMPP